jgi:uncharacterized protein
MIEQRCISAISNSTNQDGKRRVPETVIERDYCLSWFLFGLAHSPLKELLVFKGGTALRRCYFREYRFSEDLDFTMTEERPLNHIIEQLDDIFEWISDESGIEFGLGKQEDPHHHNYTLYLTYSGPLPGKEKEVKVDISFSETILQPIEDLPIIKTYDEYSDFLDEATIQVYSLNEVVIEKVCALNSPSRNEPRDLYDIYYLTEHHGIEIDFLVGDIDKKLQFKGNTLEERKGEFEKKEMRLKILWEKRLNEQMSSLPKFEEVFRAVKRTFRQAGILAE